MISIKLCKELYASSFSSSKMLVYPPMKKAPSEPAGSSSLLHTARQTSWRNPYPLPLHPHCSLLSNLQSGSTQHCTVVALNGLPVSALNDCSQSAFLSSSVSATFTPLISLSQTVSPPLKILPSAITEYGHITI